MAELHRVFQLLKKYYPIGLDPYSREYHNDPKNILLDRLCYEKLYESNYQRWKDFLTDCKFMTTQLKVLDETVLPYPCYSGSLLLFKQKTGIITFKRSLHIHKSILGKYFTIYGLDTMELNAKTKDAVSFGSIIYISPEDYYLNFYKQLRDRFENLYSGYTYVGYRDLTAIMPSLFTTTGNADGEESTLFQGLFTDEKIQNHQAVGDRFYE